jgi:hypothetical protein
MAADLPQRLSFRLVIARHICAMWGFGTEETERLLGVASSASVRDPLTREQERRLSLVAAICETVDGFCPSADEADAWLRRPHMFFGNRSALALLRESSDNLHLVHRYAFFCRDKVWDRKLAAHQQEEPTWQAR